jgi:hypothetical protein
MAKLVDAVKGLVGYWGSRENPVVDPNTIASATSITVTYPISRISGAVAINTIVVPPGMLGGIIVLLPIAGAAYTLGVTGNIGLAAAAATPLRAQLLVHDPVTNKWYPFAA